MPVDRLRNFLEENHVKFVTLSHSPAFTAQEIAASAHVPGKELIKTVMVKLDGKMAMAVIPAPDKVSANRLREATGAKEVELASEKEFADLFPCCEVGAMPPFGNLWGVDVYADTHLREDEVIMFNAGTHTELVRMTYADFERLVHPVVTTLTTRN
ncbi:MAG: YbaK/EbsC family protein [Gemmatimonadetes bacterium]|jgi:Ala-tRNA(Pro) deacylase|nr:YbaK/EbsC family protein [Gemmatimonadota bacterium]